MRGSPNYHAGLPAAAVTRNAVPDRYGGNFDKRKGRASGPSFSLIIIILFALHGRRQGHIAVDLLSIPEDGQIRRVPAHGPYGGNPAAPNCRGWAGRPPPGLHPRAPRRPPPLPYSPPRSEPSHRLLPSSPYTVSMVKPKVGMPWNSPMGQDVIDYIGHLRGRQGKAQALYRSLGLAFVLAHFHGDDADDLAVGVDERAAGVAVIHGGVCLEHGQRPAIQLHLPLQAGEHAVGKGPHGASDSSGLPITYTVSPYACNNRSRRTLPGSGPSASTALSTAMSRAGCVAHQLRLIGAGRYPAPPCCSLALGDHMGVGDDVPIRRQQDAGTHGGVACGHRWPGRSRWTALIF